VAIGAIAVTENGKLIQPKWAPKAGDLRDVGPSGPMVCCQTDSEGVEWLLCFSQVTRGAYMYLAEKDRHTISADLRSRMGIEAGGEDVRFGWDQRVSAVVMECGAAAEGHQTLHVSANKQSFWEVRSIRLRQFLELKGFKPGWLYRACALEDGKAVPLDQYTDNAPLKRVYFAEREGYERRDRYVRMNRAAKKRKVA